MQKQRNMDCPYLVQHFPIMDYPYLYIGHTKGAIECQSKQRNMIQDYFLRWSIRNIKYTKFKTKKNLNILISQKKKKKKHKHTHTHTQTQIHDISYFKIVAWYLHYQSYDLHPIKKILQFISLSIYIVNQLFIH